MLLQDKLNTKGHVGLLSVQNVNILGYRDSKLNLQKVYAENLRKKHKPK